MVESFGQSELDSVIMGQTVELDSVIMGQTVELDSVIMGQTVELDSIIMGQTVELDNIIMGQTALVTSVALCWLDHTDWGPHRQNVRSFAAKMQWCKDPGSIWMGYLLRMKREFAMCLWLCQSPLLIRLFLLVALLYCLQDHDIKYFLNILGKHADE